jgi:NADP-dependent 3-hydroxy acid dehydrogenase YdfG
MKTFKDKVAVVTGAGSGMGRYLSVLLAKDGADVVACDVNQETLNETVEMLRKYNVSVSSHVLDVADKEAIEALPQKVIDQHGKVDLVFNNAGVSTGKHFKDMEEENWDWVMDINLHGVINSTRAFIPHLIDRPEAAIVNTSSIFGMVAVPGQTVYHATKFAVRGFTESLALEMAQTNENLQIHCVHPGHVGTNIVANSRMDEEDLQTDEE